MKLWIQRSSITNNINLMVKGSDGVEYGIKFTEEFLAALNMNGVSVDMEQVRGGEYIPLPMVGRPGRKAFDTITVRHYITDDDLDQFDVDGAVRDKPAAPDKLVHREPNQNEDGTIGDTGRFL